MKNPADDRHAQGDAVERPFTPYRAVIAEGENLPVMCLRQEQRVTVEGEMHSAEIRTLHATVFEAVAWYESMDVSIVVVVTIADDDAQLVPDYGDADRVVWSLRFRAHGPRGRIHRVEPMRLTT